MNWGRWWSLGNRGERLAARFLRRNGHRVLFRSYRCPVGEVDLVTEHAGVLVFVEVKTRRSAEHGQPWEAVDRKKRGRITRVAAFFIKRYRASDRLVRFDVVAITWPVGWFARPTVEHFPDAFQAEGPWT